MSGKDPSSRAGDGGRRLQPRLGAALLVALAVPLPVSHRRSPPARSDPAVGNGRGRVPLKQVGNFDPPVYANGPKGAKGLLFVVERPGDPRRQGRRQARRAFLDIRDKVSSGGERGLLSVAFARS